ncbi:MULTISPECIES: CAP domain-containing protein [unclassified Sedimentibacter]|uniref:CAP domain-containing protein n=1 Tax=unclassified Sedimentibacter TaxID=2649220 RepID=UPI0027DFAE09|nr:CAP domain-containing protein [Sedimentibacter sp. MB35-C1]WMJ78834.1 CAP domain-containing protein [Sedimentibacter sp. MB35-C1]
MRNKILALTLATILALSSNTAFAADMNAFNFNFYDLFNNNINYTNTDYNQAESSAQKQPAENSQAETKQTANSSTKSSNSSYEQRVVQLVNVEREKNGLNPLVLDSSISNVARAKSKDMADNNYFAHQSPTYGSAGDMLRNFGINWSAWGENIASGQNTPEQVVNAWMNSEGHRANILSTNFGKIGVGYVTDSNGTPYWTQMFTN